MAKKNTPNKHNTWKKIILFIIFVVIVLAIGYLVHELTKSTPAASHSSNSKSTEAAENSANNNRKKSSNPQSTLNNGGSTSSGSTSTSNSSASGTQSSSANYQVQIVNYDISEGNLHIGDTVSGTTTGNCTLTATKAGQSTLQLANSTVKQDVNSYDCGVFNIPTSTFPASGVWTVVLTVDSGGTTNSSSINIDI